MPTTAHNFWSGSDFAFWCLVDRKRTAHFRDVILSFVQPGDIVVDAGSGTGIFTYFAMQAGAEKVYAIENDPNLFRFLSEHVAKSTYSSHVSLINADAASTELPEKADVIICEMISTGLIDELQIPVCRNLKKHLKPNGHFIPSSISSYVDLVYSENNFWGHHLDIPRYEYTWHPELKSDRVTDKAKYSEVIFAEIESERVDAEIQLKANSAGQINGIRISNKTLFPNNSVLGHSEAFCMPLILPIKERRVDGNDVFNLKLKYQFCRGLSGLEYSLE